MFGDTPGCARLTEAGVTEQRETPVIHSSADGTAESSITWSILRFLNLYRLLLAGLLFSLTLVATPLKPFGEYQPQFFAALSAFYLVFAVTCSFALLWRWPPLRKQAYTQILTDIAAITLFMHASGGVNSGIGILLVVVVAGGSLLMPSRTALFFAAVATLATLGETVYVQWQELSVPVSYTLAGMLGASYFATALLTQFLARRAHESEALAEQRAADLANMQQLTEYIIDRMQTGIVVLDAAGVIRLMNGSAARLLGVPRNATARMLDPTAPDLAQQFHAWQQDAASITRLLHTTSASTDILPRFARLGAETTSGTLIFLEDVTAIAQQAQHLKLASLGRLAASIAHEIRNPLGAISHAGQLLNESASLDAEDARLASIVCEQSQRMNKIISNVLQLSRRDHTHQTDIALQSWLKEFITQFVQSHQLTNEDIAVEHGADGITVHFDPSQLHQVLWNLCENGLRYSEEHHRPRLKLCSDPGLESAVPHIDVINFGPPITPGVAQHIFEPFFTTEQSGTGLGLYIARELCEFNQARINYIPLPDSSCFRITFADRRRRPLM